MKYLTLILTLIMLIPVHAEAQEHTVYAVTLSTAYGHTGMALPVSALFYKNASSADTSWSYLGRPNNRIYNVDFHRPTGRKMIAMATHTGVHQSWDSGDTWKVTTDWRMTEVNGIVIDQGNPDIIYASSPYGFYKTMDGGANWKMYNDGLDNIDATFVSSIVQDHSDPGRIFISTEDGVYISENEGESWKRAGLNVRHVRVIVQHPENPDVLMVGTEDHGIYISENGGLVWEKRDTGVVHPTFYIIAFDPNNPDIIYAGGFQTGVYKSIDGGRKWKHYFAGLGSLDIHGIAVLPGNSDIVYAGTMDAGVYKSMDGGLSWEYAGIKNGQVMAVKIEPF
jgi:hypothetical protein